MARTKISEFSATAASNTDIDSINIAEGCAPSGINDAIRELMSQLKDFQTGAVGDSFNGPVGTTTAAAGAFTTLSASSTVSGTGFSTYLASPPAIGGTAAAAGAFTTLAASGAVTLSGGTANGVTYLNGSKVLTSGSALTFDGTNLGLGVTPSAWNTLKAIEQQNGVFWASYSGDADFYFGANAYYSSGWIRKIAGYASYYRQTTGQHQWAVAASSTAGSAISFTQAMTLNASGNLGIGTTNPTSKLQVGTGAAASTVQAQILGGVTVFENSGATTLVPTITFNNDLDTGINNPGANLLGFYTNGAERARITTSGEFIMGGTSVATSGSRLSIVGSTTWGVGPSPAGSTFYIYNSSNVGVYLTDGANTWASSSDERKKDIIEPITDASNKVNQLRAVIGKYKTDAEGTRRSFLIAQDLQTVLPESVDSSEEDNLGVRYTDVIPLLVAAIKEQQTVITSLKARLDAANL
jgi:hypothetical protein